MTEFCRTYVLGMFLVGLFVSTIATSDAHAQSSEPSASPPSPPEAEPFANDERASNDNLVSAFLALGYAYSGSGFGFGFRYQDVVVPDGIIKNGRIHDELGLEGGIDYYRYNFGYGIGPYDNTVTYNEFAVTFGAAWNFWLLDDRLALYPKLDMSYRIGSFATSTGDMSGYGGLWIQGTAGAVYRLSGVSLRAELGSGSLRLGAGFSFF
jgi:hypothetical protein